MKFADPKNDIAFKKIFGDENHKEVLISFLNAVLDFQGEQTIVEVELTNPYQVPKIEALKETILDIKVTNQKQEHFIVEMQKKDLGDFAKRSLYYTSKAYVNQLDAGKNYHKLKKVYFIGLLNFTMFEGQSCISRHLILNQETNTQDLDDFEFCFIELQKFSKPLGQLSTLLDKWIYFIKNASSLEMVPKEFTGNSALEQAFDSAQMYNWNREEMDVYDYIHLKAWDEINAIDTAVKKAEKRAKQEGLEQGLELGIEQEQRLSKKQRAQDKIEIAKNAISQGLEIQTIAAITGLSIEEIEKLS
ncbi:MAG: Rpn family recombination-promoting nuclease/putative transposase [Gammaproteobacteria bacterium]|jgi:predicted transposase/invertase (TIGR01784 family)|nr:Rpn family recombination-promoting nuclease/putative transposase [Gammaproteobacteria bacterium]